MLVEHDDNQSQNNQFDNQDTDNQSHDDILAHELREKFKEEFSQDNTDNTDDTDDNNIGDDDKKSEKQPEKQAAEKQDTDISFPKSWGKDKHELFKNLPIEAQQQILKRDADIENGIKILHERIKPQEEFVKNFSDIITPYKQQLESLGDPSGLGTLQSFLEPAKILNFGTPEQKAQMLLSVASQYGVDLFDYMNYLSQNGGVPPVTQQPSLQNLPEFQQLNDKIKELTEFKKNIFNEREAALETEVVSEIEAIMGDTDNYPFFQQIIPDMQRLLEGGIAENLKDAYAKAVMLSPETQDKYIAQQAEKKLAEQQQKNQQRLQSVKSNMMSPKNNKAQSYDNDDSEISEEEFD